MAEHVNTLRGTERLQNRHVLLGSLTRTVFFYLVVYTFVEVLVRVHLDLDSSPVIRRQGGHTLLNDAHVFQHFVVIRAGLLELHLFAQGVQRLELAELVGGVLETVPVHFLEVF